MTSTELSLLSDIVDSDNDGTASSCRPLRHDFKGTLDIQLARRGKLRNLRVTRCFEDLAHLEKHFLKTQVLIGRLVIRVQDLEHGRRTSSSGAAYSQGETMTYKTLEKQQVLVASHLYLQGREAAVW